MVIDRDSTVWNILNVLGEIGYSCIHRHTKPTSKKDHDECSWNARRRASITKTFLQLFECMSLP